MLPEFIFPVSIKMGVDIFELNIEPPPLSYLEYPLLH